MSLEMETTDSIVQFFKHKFPFNLEGLENFAHAFKKKTYRKNTLLLNFGETERHLSFLDEGVVREFYSAEDKEKNINFYTNREFFTDFSSFLHAKPTKKFQETLSDVQIRTLDKRKFTEFLDEYACGKSFIEKIFQNLLDKKELDEYKIATKTPDELYLDIVENKEEWLKKIPQYHIASYLGVTPETLSRIKSRLR